ncbi:hypothetical protein [Succinispira mobilis]|uniref:SLAC1 family transporter n=1 Tax=Succinispira mobilis TaxID=78120 RepID=UPI0008FC18E0
MQLRQFGKIQVIFSFSYFRDKLYLSWWAYSFPIAAITIATYLMYSQTHLLLYKFILLCLFTLLSLFILLLLKNTICAMLNSRICVQED